jgi:hypothetical protein
MSSTSEWRLMAWGPKPSRLLSGDVAWHDRCMETKWVPKVGSPPIHFDFNRSGTVEAIVLDHPVVVAELAKHGVELKDGLVLNLWDEDGNNRGDRDDMLATGVVRHDALSGRWVVDVTAWSHESEGRL